MSDFHTCEHCGGDRDSAMVCVSCGYPYSSLWFQAKKLKPEQEQKFLDWMEAEIFDGDNYLPQKVLKGLYRIIDRQDERSEEA